MMEFNWRQINLYTRMFTLGEQLMIGNTYGGANLNQNNIFNRLCIINLTGDTIEIPVFAKSHIESTLIISPSINKIVLPLYSNSSLTRVRTSDSIIKKFFVEGNLSERLRKVTTSSGEIYYGMKGIIFDEHFNLLMMVTMTLDKRSKRYNKITIYIHPEVFLNTKGLIHKHIIKKMIPFYLSYNEETGWGLRDRDFSINRPVRPQIVIEDVANKFIQSPNKPSPQDCTNDKLNQLLIENINDVLNQI